MFGAAGEPLDQDAGPFFLSLEECRFDRFAGRQLDEHATGMVGVARLDDDGDSLLDADRTGRAPGVGRAVDRPPFRNGHAGGQQQRLRQFLVLGDLLSNGAGAVGLGGPDAALLAALAELHKAAGVKPPMRDAAGAGGFDDRHSARAEAAAVDEVAKPLDRLGDVERPVVDGGETQLAPRLQAGPSHRLVDILDGDFVQPFAIRFAGAAEADRIAGQRLQFERHVFKNVG